MTYNEVLWKIEREKLKKPVLFLYESTYSIFILLYALSYPLA